MFFLCYYNFRLPTHSRVTIYVFLLLLEFQITHAFKINRICSFAVITILEKWVDRTWNIGFRSVMFEGYEL